MKSHNLEFLLRSMAHTEGPRAIGPLSGLLIELLSAGPRPIEKFQKLLSILENYPAIETEKEALAIARLAFPVARMFDGYVVRFKQDTETIEMIGLCLRELGRIIGACDFSE